MVTPQHNGVFKPGIIPGRLLDGPTQEVKKEATPNQIQASHVQKAAVQAGMPPSSNFQTASRSKISTCSYPKWMTKLGNFAKDVVTNIKNHILVLKMDTAEKSQTRKVKNESRKSYEFR